MEHRFAIASFAVLIAALFIGCVATPLVLSGLPFGTPSRSDIIVALDDGFFSIDPVDGYTQDDLLAIRSVYDTLVTYGSQDGSVILPSLATSVPTIANGGISADGLQYTFTIRSGVHFHDGTTLNASDVVYSIRRVLYYNDINGVYQSGLGKALLPSYVAPGIPVNMDEVNASVGLINGNVQFNLTSLEPRFLHVLASSACSVVSKVYVDTHGGLTSVGSREWMKQHEMGSGPLSLSEYDHDHMTLVKNNAYFGEKAKSTTVRLNFVNDIGARVQMLEAGAVDIARVLPSNRSTLAADPDLTVLPNLTSFGTSFIALNEHISPGARYGIGDIPDDFFADVNVRLAFAHAFNQTKFIQQVSTGDRTSLDSLVPAGIAGYDPTIASYDYNLQKVADFLKVAQDHRAGHVGSYADNGFTLILYGYLGGTASQAVVNEFAQAFAAISANPAYGVTGTITVSAPPLWLDFPSYLINLFGGMLPTGITGFVPQYGDPGEYSISMLRTGGRLASVSGMSNASLDAKIDVMSVEMNVNARLSEIRNISLECQKNAYYIWAGQAMRLAAMGSNVTGFAWSPVWDEPIGTLHDLAIYAPAPVTVAPANLVVMPGNTTADLTWDAVTETQILYYQIYRGTSAGSLEMLVATQVTNFHDTGLTNGQTYYYAVAAVGPSGEGPMCAPSSAVPHAVLPVAPADYTLAIAGLVVIAAVIVTVFVVIRVRRPKAP